MAHLETKVISLNEKYRLGKYEFSIKTRDIPQTDLMDIIATATGPNGKMGAKTMQVPKTAEIEGWYVNASSTTADVYVKLGESGSDIPYTTVSLDTPTSNGYLRPYYDSVPVAIPYGNRNAYFAMASEPTVLGLTQYNDFLYVCVISGNIGASYNNYALSTENSVWIGIVTYANVQGAQVFSKQNINASSLNLISIPASTVDPENKTLEPDFQGGEYLIGRFEIDIRIAGGTAGNNDGYSDTGGSGDSSSGDGGYTVDDNGNIVNYDPDTGWQDLDDGQETLWPGDEGYPDPEDPDYPGDDEPYYPPSKTLYLEVEGALSGRHNDPLNDTSYSYVPADKATVKSYGYGGDGGHGGGGGGGASSVIVYKFATDKADSKEITVKPKRHGYGSGGGKGGKGGDGCILIYY